MGKNPEKRKKQNIEQLLREHKRIEITPNGFSMYPLFYSGRDRAIIEAAELRKLRRGDVVLYRRREEGILVLHRIWKIKKEGVYLVGDHQTEIEGPLEKRQIKGKMVAFKRKGKQHSTRNLWYILYSRLWLRLRPFRHKIELVVHRLKF